MIKCWTRKKFTQELKILNSVVIQGKNQKFKKGKKKEHSIPMLSGFTYTIPVR